jgi:hypothetical protein
MASNGAIPPPLPDIPEDQKFDGIRLAWAPIERKIQIALKGQGLIGYVDGTITIPPIVQLPLNAPGTTVTPTPVYSTNPSRDEWTFRNDRARGMIESYVLDLPSLVPSVDKMNAYEVFEALKNEFGKSDEKRKILTNRRLRNHIFRDNEPIDTFFKTFRELRREAIEGGNDVSDTVFKDVILMAFPTLSFDTIIQNITGNPTIYPTSASVIQQIVFQYSRTESRPDAAVSGDRLPQANVALQNRIEHLERQLAVAVGGSGARGNGNGKKCTNPNCLREGHLAEDCFRKGGGKEGQYPPWWKGKKDTTLPTPAANTTVSANVSVGELTQHYAGYSASMSITDPEDETFADSGASDHFFRKRSDFLTYTPCSRLSRSSEASTTLKIVGYGKAQKSFNHEGKTVVITFEEAFHSPSVTSDLVSISKLCDKGMTTVFGKQSVKFFSESGAHILTGQRHGGLYRLQENKTSALVVKSRTLDKPVDIEGWHRRFGHAGISRIRLALERDLLNGLIVIGDPGNKPPECDPCHIGQAKRRAFDAKTEVESRILERVHIDLTGPMRTRALGGFFYSMPIVDGCSAMTRDFYLMNKESSSTLAALEKYKALAENETGNRLLYVRVDGGKEFSSGPWLKWAEENGVKLEVTPAYSSAANGIVERKHGVTFDHVRTILYESSLPPYLWTYACAYVVYTENLLPAARTGFKIPAELWYRKKMDVAHLRPWGAVAWGTIVDGTPGKLDPRGFSGRMIGYGERGVYLLYLPSGRVVASRDVSFDERVPAPLTSVAGERGDDVDGEDEEPSQHLDNVNTTDADDSSKISEPVISDNQKVPDQTSIPLPQPQQLRRSSRNRTPSAIAKASSESENRQRESSKARLEWATDTRRPQANFTALTQNLPNEVDDTFNLALIAVGLPPVPKSYSKAMEDPDRWIPAIRKEIRRMQEFGVFGPLQDPPSGATVLNPLWVFAHKLNGSGEIVDEKARLVVNGGSQVEGRDFFEVFAAVLRFESLRILIAVWITLGYFIWQIDFASAYLNADMEEEMYVRPPDGFEGKGTGKVMRMKKSLYGSMQAGRNWWRLLDATYKDLGYKRSQADQCVRTRKSDVGETMTGTYTDDTLGGSSSKEEMDRAKAEIGSRYRIKETDTVQFALGMRLVHDRESGTATLSMPAYWDQLFARFGLQDLKPKATPYPPGLKLTKDQSPKTDADRHYMKDKPYGELLGGIQFGQGACRPDFAFETNDLAQFSQDPGPDHWNALLHLCRYIIGTKQCGVVFKKSGTGLTPKTYCDANHAACTDTRRSVTGVITMLAGGPVFWMSKRQDVVALSTTEAEYIAYGKGAQQAKWIHNFMNEIGYPSPLPSQLFADNMGAIAISENPKFHQRVKHIDIRFHFLRDLVEAGEVKINYVPSEENLADILTKPLGTTLHRRIVELMGMKDGVGRN